MLNHFHTWGSENEGNMGDTSADRPRITIASDASLDEGAIIRTTAESSPLSSGVEYFLGLQSDEAETLIAALDFYILAEQDDTAEMVRARAQRIIDYMRAG